MVKSKVDNKVIDLRGNLTIILPAQNHNCGYFKDRKALCDSFIMLCPGVDTFEDLMEKGFRHFGPFYWTNKCENCTQCVPIRIPVQEFQLSKSKKIIINKNLDLDVKISKPVFSDKKYKLFREHGKKFPYSGSIKHSREEFQAMFFDPPHPFCKEYQYFLGKKLIAVGYVDETPKQFSSTYFFYDLNYNRRSLGNFSILFELTRARQKGAKFYYLGYYLSKNSSMKYKIDFFPSEVQIKGKWVPFVQENGTCLFQNEPLESHNQPFKIKTDFDLEEHFPSLSRLVDKP
ncbi:hypothetical protein ACFL35_10755 [Candidatus Riflebacteria bacterium]